MLHAKRKVAPEVGGSATEDPDRGAVALAKRGHPTGLEVLYRKYVDAMFRYCYWQTNRSADAEDLTQDIFIQVAKSLRTFTGASTFRHWLYVIAQRQVAAWLRKKYQLPTTSLLEALSADADNDRDAPEMEDDGAETADAWSASLPAVQDHHLVLLDTDEWINPDNESTKAQFLSQIFASLKPLERAVVLARLSQELSVEETAKSLNISTSNVKVILHRALAKLRSRFAPPTSETRTENF